MPYVPPPHFDPNKNGTYKILQAADLHFSVDHGKCKNTDLKPCDHGDDVSAKLFAHALDAEKPDLVVFTGDQLNGQKTSWDTKSVLAKFVTEVVNRKIPWAAVLGNHDDEETDMTRGDIMTHLSKMPYSLSQSGPTDVDGFGNYVLKVKSGDP